MPPIRGASKYLFFQIAMFILEGIETSEHQKPHFFIIPLYEIKLVAGLRQRKNEKRESRRLKLIL